jgi:hypothetical protein
MLDLDKIDRYILDTNEMVLQLGNYVAAADNRRTEEDDGAVRRLRIAAAALVGACEALSRMPMRMSMPPPSPSLPATNLASRTVFQPAASAAALPAGGAAAPRRRPTEANAQ